MSLQKAIERENARVTHEWDALMARIGVDCGSHPEAVELAEKQGDRMYKIMGDYGYRFATEEERKNSGCAWVK